GIAVGVGGDLGRGGVEQVDVDQVGEADQVDEDVGHLLGQRLPTLRTAQPGGDLLVAPPLDVLEKLADLDGQGDGEVLRGVEPLPVAIGGEAPQLPGQVVQGHGAVR